jgi:hypothetical protein
MSYKKYISNLENFKNVDLYKNGGILKINLGNESYIMKCKNIIRDMIALTIKLENKNGGNIKLQKYYDNNKSNFNVEILEISNEDLSKKKIDYINKFHSKLNYQLASEGFSEEHKRHLSECKTGEKHNRAKLTEIQAIQIKLLALEGNMTSNDIGELFNISAPQVRKIKQGRAWSHLVV